MQSCLLLYMNFFKVGNMPQHKKEAIDNGTRSKLDRCLVLTSARIYESLAVEVEQWLNRKPYSSSTNAEHIAAWN